jgi:hypothetical protein
VVDYMAGRVPSDVANPEVLEKVGLTA